MRYANIKYCDIADGEGVRTTLFVSGCRRHCPFCFNDSAWSFDAGKPFDANVEDDIIKSMEPFYIDGLSVLGGEPMEPENQEGLVDFLEKVKKTYPQKDIWLYSGFTLEELQGKVPVKAPYTTSPRTDVTDRILNTLDVLVDGPFIQAEKDISLRFRGSANQRLIDMPKTLKTGRVVIWHDDPLFENHSL
ncbi:anaerobic ribonucleoside-triphosphate reductase activating protein [Atopobium sp. oral taxon 416]|jgi:anaerobic ribonucleoside-triphosphate reductase activating protein|uniref:anaerobic ribonucleoside-triphosphate reductase activating protein n=1 Tax=Atopobium sp. oral taxon 416 TaxID=712157 RepID=UPI001BA9D96C|nr:anaerobic ribonucleoside-triphosphate reductase activating protein [Atopobium sp. oral taxon 416]QUC02587.1 anaerobic ribonucleoside-triphosphate reductase activating protein [Atopobium sp. oral taxon 416]